MAAPTPGIAPDRRRARPASQQEGSARRRQRVWGWLAAACGMVAAMVTLAVAEIVAAFVSASASPLFAVGSWIVDLAPAGFKEWIIRIFGTGDKLLLFVCLGALLVVLSAAIG